MNLKKFTKKIKLSPALGTSFINWMKLIIKNGWVFFKKIGRVSLITALILIWIPFRIFEKLRFHKLLDKIQIKKPPIFIIGHWRSGTTYLHNLFVQDPQFGFITMVQAMFPGSFLTTTFFRRFLDVFMPNKRPMDNMEITPVKPQEEELAMSNLSPYSFYNAFYYPKNMMKYYYYYLRYKINKEVILKKWKETYMNLLKKATFNMGRRQLILKNPANTTRIKVLLEMFPNAKFVEIHRNHYIVYPSMLTFYQKAIKFFILKDISYKKVNKNILKIYKNMMNTYFKQRKLIPEENLVEIKFEEFERHPLEEMEEIYKKFHIKGFEKNKSCFKTHLESIKDYKKNKYKLNPNTISRIDDYWEEIITKLQYHVPKEVL